MRLSLNDRKYRMRGMSLLEIAIGVLILGVLMAGAGLMYDAIQQQRKILVTHAHMDEIVSALSTYAETTGRVPCPGNPSAADQSFGWEFGVTVASLNVSGGQFPIGTCATSNPPPMNGAISSTVGIVPFMTLNLSDSIARDGWGHYFTFAISPQYARSNDQSHNPDGSIPAQPNAAIAPTSPPPTMGAPPLLGDLGAIHARCRTQGWTGRFESVNISAVKARFCCNDISVNIPAGPPLNYNTPGSYWNTASFDASSDLVIEFTDGVTKLSPARDPVGTRFTNAAPTSANDINDANYLNSNSLLPAPGIVDPNPPIPGRVAPSFDGYHPIALATPVTPYPAGNVYEFLGSTALLTVPNTVTGTGLTQIPTAVTSAQSKILTPAMVLISHGPDGEGAFLANGTTATAPAPNALEAINATGNKAGNLAGTTFIDGPSNLTAGPSYFNDIVRWMTQDSLMAAHGALSCQYP